MSYDYLVIGQGLAGSAIAIHLLRRGRKFLVVDLPGNNISSFVAAGIYNPITGQNWVKTWMADHIFPYTHQFYREVERITKSEFLYDRTVYRPFSELSEQNDWMGRSGSSIYAAFIDSVHTEPIDESTVINPFGGLSIKSGGNLKIPSYLSAVRRLLIENQSFVEEQFDWGKVNLHDNVCEFEHNTFKKIIFCQGPQTDDTDLWNFLPFRRVKGELLSVSVSRRFEKIYNKGVFILPLGNGTYKIGATYDYQNMELEVTEKGRKQLQERIRAFFKPNYEIEGQSIGIRPATIDRKPFLGMHPNDEKLVIFNGLGAKGVTLAPYFADHLLDHIENDSYLMKEVDINRFIK